jgi:BirA family biotin operon repressor/biotin-[acetyl-CoA-carboxylase] ligase
VLPAAPLTIEDIQSTLATSLIGRRIHLYPQLDSTNSEAMALAQAGAAHGTVVIAESQSAGRGRHARNWYSPPGANIYCSIIARGTGQGLSLAEWLSWVPLASALAAAEAIQHVAGLALSLKWPNDLLFEERKVGGILCESALAPAGDPAVVIGIGLNVNAPRESFPEELRPIAGSLAEAVRRSVDRNRLIAQLLLEMEHCLEELRARGPARLQQAYTSRCNTLGRRVRVSMGNGQDLLGKAEAIGADGALRVRPLASSPGAAPPPLIDVRAADVVHLRE